MPSCFSASCLAAAVSARGCSMRPLAARSPWSSLRRPIVCGLPWRMSSGIFGDRPVAVCRELTKLHEEIFRGTAPEALEHFDSPRGEFVVVVAGEQRPAATAPRHPWTNRKSVGLCRTVDGRGLRSREVVAEASVRFGIPKNYAYRLWLEEGNAGTNEGGL